jgi:hypothetical protein
VQSSWFGILVSKDRNFSVFKAFFFKFAFGVKKAKYATKNLACVPTSDKSLFPPFPIAFGLLVKFFAVFFLSLRH